jgi:hypothetical protein
MVTFEDLGTVKIPSTLPTVMLYSPQHRFDVNPLQIARRCFRQSADYASRRSSTTPKDSRPASATKKDPDAKASEHEATASNLGSAQPLRGDQQMPASHERSAAPSRGPNMQLSAGATIGASRISPLLGDKGPSGMQRAKGLLEHLMVDNGCIDRFTLSDGLQSLGYRVTDQDLDHLLAQLKAVPGLTTSTAITSNSLAASQIDVTQEEEWAEMARIAFNALDLDGDGTVQRSEMQVVLAGRCPEHVCKPYTACVVHPTTSFVLRAHTCFAKSGHSHLFLCAWDCIYLHSCELG